MSTFPIYKQSKTTGVIVKFVATNKGEVIDPGRSSYILGEMSGNWAPYTKKDVWQDCSDEWLKENVKTFKEKVESLALFQTISMENSSSTLTKVPAGYVMTSHSGHQLLIKEHTKEVL